LSAPLFLDPISLLCFFLSVFSLICNEAALLPEGQCCISLVNLREGHNDKESCHHILQFHIKHTVHGKDREGTRRAWGGLGRKEYTEERLYWMIGRINIHVSHIRVFT
jgi:hypothetical protein